MKKKITRYEVTEAQRQAIAACVTALGEVVKAHQAANPHYENFEINLKVTHERKLTRWEEGPLVWGFFTVGNYSDGNGCGHSLDDALKEMFGKTDASEKREYAKRCRRAAEQAEAEAAELEKTGALS